MRDDRGAARDAVICLARSCPDHSLALGVTCGLGYCRFEHADQIRSSRAAPRAASFMFAHEESEAAMAAEKDKADGRAAGTHGGDGAEVAEDDARVVEFAAAVDVAKGFGMVCTRVPGSRADRRCQKVWRVEARFSEVQALMGHLRCEGIQRLVLESTSDYWRMWYYLAEAAGLEVWLVNARDVKHLPGRGKSDRADCVWLCKLNERGMLRRSFVPPEAVRDLRALTRTRARLAQDQARHQARVEKILEDALIKVSVVISDLFGASGRRFLDALVAGERSPKALAALGDQRLRATRAELEEALTGRFRDVHATGIGMHLRLIDAICAEVKMLDERIEAQLTAVPRTHAVCAQCGAAGSPDGPECACAAPAPLGPGGPARGDHRDRRGDRPGPDRRARHRSLPVPHARTRRRMGAADSPVPPVRGHHETWADRERQPVPARRPRASRHGGRENRYQAGSDVPADSPQTREIQGDRRRLPGHLRDRLEAHLRPRSPVRRARPGLLSPAHAPPGRPAPRSARSNR